METVGEAEAVEALDDLTRFVFRHTSLMAGLSVSALSTLSTLASAGPMRVTDLAGRENVSQPSMTTMIARLERQGLVERRDDPSDGRSSLIALTEAGRQMRSRRRASRTAFLTELVTRLDPTEAAALATLTPTLRRLTDPSVVPAAIAAAEHAEHAAQRAESPNP